MNQSQARRSAGLTGSAARPLDLVTAVLPTHNRAAFLSRAALYYRDAPFKVVVVDSSAERFAGLMPPSFVYHHCPDWSFGARLAFGFAQVETPFCLMINDDDFFFDAALEEEIGFLQRRPDYASAQGYYMLNWPVERSKKIGPHYMHRLGFHIDAEDVGGRLLQLRSNYMHTSYSVHRTADMQQMAKRVADIVSPFAIEAVVSFGSVAFGKHIMLPHLHCVREVEPNSTGSDKTGFYGLSKLPPRMREYSYAFYVLQTIVRDVLGYSNDDAFDVIDRITPDPLVSRSPEERTGPPVGTVPDEARNLSTDDWKRMMSTTWNAKLSNVDAEMRRFLAEAGRWAAGGGALPDSFRRIGLT